MAAMLRESLCPVNMVHHSMPSAKFLHNRFKHRSLLLLSGTPDLR
jgi:hypothetical protein